uniref:cutinase n=1 Tax=Bionectria ochroleuca TaxID=29856 RepID=A0A8H7N3T6_BIOOC
MKFLTLLFALAVVHTHALPTTNVEVSEDVSHLEKRSFLNQNDLEAGPASQCPEAILIFARGSTEPGNMGLVAGPALAATLQAQYDNIWIQGVGGAYTALISPNYLPNGTNRQSIDEGKRLFQLANIKCPKTPVVAGGYRQGTAVIWNAISELDEVVRKNIVGVTLFGYTKNLENKAQIPNYPPERTVVFCEYADAVCLGIMIPVPSHFFYADDAIGAAPRFLTAQIAAYVPAVSLGG